MVQTVFYCSLQKRIVMIYCTTKKVSCYNSQVHTHGTGTYGTLSTSLGNYMTCVDGKVASLDNVRTAYST